MTGEARPHLDDAERRRRLVERHHLGATARSVESAVRDVVVLHASDPVTPFLSLWARVPGVTVAAIEAALYRDRSLWRGHAMRRTLFVSTSDELGTLNAATGRAVAEKERRRLLGWLAESIGEAQAGSWLADARAEVLHALSGGAVARTTELTEAVPRLAHRITVGSGRSTQEVPASTRVLYVMAMDLDLVRAHPAGTWRGSQFHWADAASWYADQPEVLEPIDDVAAAQALLASRYLARFGPVTTTDLRWWTGWTVAQTRAALGALDAVEVDLEGGGTGWVLAHDTATTEASDEPTVTLLPGLDGTPMGWKERDFYLGADDVPQLFDRNGNVGPTVWVDGFVVGGWSVRPTGEVVTSLLRDVGAEAAERVDARAAALADWLDGTPVSPRFGTPLERRLRES